MAVDPLTGDPIPGPMIDLTKPERSTSPFPARSAEQETGFPPPGAAGHAPPGDHGSAGCPPPGLGAAGYPAPAYGMAQYPPYGMAQYPPYGMAQYPPAVHGVARPTNGLAVASLVVGAVWLFWIGSVLALVLGYVARGQIRRTGEGGDGVAVAGIVLGWVGVGTLVLLIVLGVSGNS
jgi:hypothetical protein